MARRSQASSSWVCQVTVDVTQINVGRWYQWKSTYSLTGQQPSTKVSIRCYSCISSHTMTIYCMYSLPGAKTGGCRVSRMLCAHLDVLKVWWHMWKQSEAFFPQLCQTLQLVPRRLVRHCRSLLRSLVCLVVSYEGKQPITLAATKEETLNHCRQPNLPSHHKTLHRTWT